AIAATGTSAVSSYVAIDLIYIIRNRDNSMTYPTRLRENFSSGDGKRDRSSGHNQHAGQRGDHRDAHRDAPGEPVLAGADRAQPGRQQGDGGAGLQHGRPRAFAYSDAAAISPIISMAKAPAIHTSSMGMMEIMGRPNRAGPRWAGPLVA